MIEKEKVSAEALNLAISDLGWDQPAGVYSYKDGELVPIVTGYEHPIKMIANFMQTKDLSSYKGSWAVIATMEGWAYPEDVLMDGGPALTAEQTMELFKAVPPSKHPMKDETRITSVVYPDGSEDTSIHSRSGRNMSSDNLTAKTSGVVIEGLRALMEVIK